MDSPTHIRVFLASPGDVPDERRAARDVVERINRSTGRVLGWHIDLLGWEDTLPGASRPQDLINQDVDACDLFIGLLYKKWGTPTGTHTSGFEEEYTRAHVRRESANSPDIWLFFKQVAPDLLEDPGEHLQKVLDFKAAQQGRVLYKEVADCPDWINNLTEYLTRYIAEHHRDTQSELEQTREPIPPTTSLPTPPLPQQKVPPANASSQLKAALSRAQAVLEEGAQFNDLDEATLTRLYLGAASWLSLAQTRDALSVHAVNQVYEHRKSMHPTAPEGRMLLLTLFANMSSENVPGWFWLRRLNGQEQEKLVIAIARQGDISEARVGAIRLMRDARIEIPDSHGDRETILGQLLWSTATGVAAAALDYLAVAGRVGDFPLLDTLAGQDQERARDASRVKTSILAREDPLKAFQAVIDLPSPPSMVLRMLEAARFSIDRETGLKGLEHRDTETRAFSLNKLAAARKLRKEDISRALDDPAYEVRKVAVQAALKAGLKFDRATLEEAINAPEDNRFKRIDDERNLRNEIYESLSKEELGELVDWYSVTGPAAYRALGLNHFDLLASDIRSNLSDRFESARQKTHDEYRERFGDHADPLIEGFSRNFIEYQRSEFMVAALAALARNGEPADVKWGRLSMYADRSWERLAALDVIGRFGSKEDIPALVGMTSDYFVKERAAQLAMQLTSDRVGTAPQLFDRNDEAVTRTVLEALPTGEPDADALIQELLRSESLTVRRLAVAAICRRYSRGSITTLLDEYLDASPYFYNVPTWIDRWLYSRSALRSYFVRSIQNV